MPVLDSTFAGIHLAGSGVDYSRTAGPNPNVTSLSLVGHDLGLTIGATGDLFISDGTTTVTIALLRITSILEANSSGGQITQVTVEDTRRTWSTRGHISGEWNRPGQDGEENAQRSAQQLVALCLDALDEVGYDVSALPADFYPYVKWEYCKPGEALNGICDMCGCVLTLAADGSAVVVTLGVGDVPPAGYRKRQDLGSQITWQPTMRTIRGARAIIQRDSTLVPVALDTDGEPKAFEDLSYYAAAIALVADGGWKEAGDDDATAWDRACTAQFGKWAFAGTEQQKHYAQLAQASVRRWFRLADADRVYCPILQTICETADEADPEHVGETRKTWMKPYCTTSGNHFDKESHAFIAYGMGLIVSEFELDADGGIVKLREQASVAHPTVADLRSVAEVVLTWACESRQADGSLDDDDYYTYSEGSGADEEVTSVDWLVLRGILDTGSASGGVLTWLNRGALDAIASKLLSLAWNATTWLQSAEVEYAGLVYLLPDGAIRQVNWHVGADGATTKLMWNTERPPISGARLERKIKSLQKSLQAEMGAAAKRDKDLAHTTKPQRAGGRAGQATGGHDLKREGALIGHNATAVKLPAAGLVRIANSADSRWNVEASRPTAAGQTDLAIADTEIHIKPDGGAEGGIGRLWTGVGSPHWVTVADAGSLAVNDHIGSQANSTIGISDASGPFLVLQIDAANNRALVIRSAPAGAGGGADLNVTVYNDSGGQLVANDVVRGSGSEGANPKVDIADTSGWSDYYVIQETIANGATGLAKQVGDLTCKIGTGGVTAGETADVVGGETGICTAKLGAIFVKKDNGDGTCVGVITRQRGEFVTAVDANDTATGQYKTLKTGAGYTVTSGDGAVTISLTP